jgi:hypothetical protein
MKLLTLLEEAQYTKTTFVWEDKRCKARYAPVASCRFLKPDELIVFLTREAESSIYPDFRAALPEDLPVEAVLVPAGSSAEELWQIAQTINQSVQDGEEVALDITHGPLSFPLVAMMVVIFMRVARGIPLKAILYGAYGIDKGVETGITPVFDLVQMLNWVEWFVAADRFASAGDADNLSQLLRKYRSQLVRTAHGDKEVLNQLGSLGKLAGVIENISQSLHMIRPYQAMTHIADLEARLEEALPLLETPHNPLPTPVLLERLKTVYTPLAHPDPGAPEQACKTLEIERRLINWYAERELWVEAVTLAREWLVSWAMLQLDLRDFTGRTARQRVESVLAAEAHDYMNSGKLKQPYQAIFLGNLPQIEDALALWLELIEVRNDINHAGKRPHPSTPKALVARTQKCVQSINQLPLGRTAQAQAAESGSLT